MILILAAAAIGILMISKGAFSGASGMGATATDSSENPNITRSNPWNLPDIDSANQAGGYATTYDENFEKASGQTGVPFALIKAHAIRESSLKPTAYHFDNASEGASFGLMQVEWVWGSGRFGAYGVQDVDIGMDGSGLYDPDTNAMLGAEIIKDNLNRLGGNLRDAVNAYNTGVSESVRQAPANYVNDVLGYYGKIIGGSVS